MRHSYFCCGQSQWQSSLVVATRVVEDSHARQFDARIKTGNSCRPVPFRPPRAYPRCPSFVSCHMIGRRSPHCSRPSCHLFSLEQILAPWFHLTHHSTTYTCIRFSCLYTCLERRKSYDSCSSNASTRYRIHRWQAYRLLEDQIRPVGAWRASSPVHI